MLSFEFLGAPEMKHFIVATWLAVAAGVALLIAMLLSKVMKVRPPRLPVCVTALPVRMGV